MSVITRFAPSPTGDLHLGHILAAKVARDLAKQSPGGKFLLRHEDIDGGRVKEECYARIEVDLQWLGLTWDGGALRQSSRLEAYAAALDAIKDLGLAYPCFCTRKDIQAEVKRMLSAPHGNEALLYPGLCRDIDPREAEKRISSGEPHTWRLDSAKAFAFHGKIGFHDLSHGTSAVDVMVNGDAVLARKDIGTSYHLAVVVDDAFQGVTHVTRGEDLLGATHIQRQIQAILGYPEPAYFHHGLVRDENGIRLAKRDAAMSIRTLRESGLSAAEILEMAEHALNIEQP
jgi:glutamyl-Q tRNA(Asp) synthetase